MKLSIRWKLLGAFALDLLLMMALGSFALFQMGMMHRKATLVEPRTISSLRNVDKINAALIRYRAQPVARALVINVAFGVRLPIAVELC